MFIVCCMKCNNSMRNTVQCIFLTRVQGMDYSSARCYFSLPYDLCSNNELRSCVLITMMWCIITCYKYVHDDDDVDDVLHVIINMGLQKCVTEEVSQACFLLSGSWIRAFTALHPVDLKSPPLHCHRQSLNTCIPNSPQSRVKTDAIFLSLLEWREVKCSERDLRYAANRVVTPLTLRSRIKQRHRARPLMWFCLDMKSAERQMRWPSPGRRPGEWSGEVAQTERNFSD